MYKDKSRLQGADMYIKPSKSETGIMLFGMRWDKYKYLFPSTIITVMLKALISIALKMINMGSLIKVVSNEPVYSDYVLTS